MKRLRMIGLALVALFALGAFMTPTAMALEEGFLNHDEFFLETENSVKPTLELENKEKIACLAMSLLEAHFENAHHGSGDLHLVGCKAEGLVPVNTLGDEKELILTKILFLLCLVNSSTLLFGIWLEPTAAVHIEVPAIQQLWLVNGGVIGHILGGNGPKKLFLADMEGKEGKQTSTLECTSEGKLLTHTLRAAKDSAAADKPASENATFDLSFSTGGSLTD